MNVLGREQIAAAFRRAGQLLFATEALKRECGVRCDGDEAAFAERLMVDTADISGAFWRPSGAPPCATSSTGRPSTRALQNPNSKNLLPKS